MPDSTSAILKNLAESTDPAQKSVADAVMDYMETRDEAIVGTLPRSARYQARRIAYQAGHDADRDEAGQAIAEMVAILLKGGPANYDHFLVERFALHGLGADCPQIEQVLIDAAARVGLEPVELAAYLLLERGFRFRFGWEQNRSCRPEEGTRESLYYLADVPPESERGWGPSERLVWGLSDREIIELLEIDKVAEKSRSFQGALALFRPEPLRAFLENSEDLAQIGAVISWRHILSSSEVFDDLCLRYAELCADPLERFRAVLSLFVARDGQHAELLHESATDEAVIHTDGGIQLLAVEFPGELCREFATALREKKVNGEDFDESRLNFAFRRAAERWDTGGREVFEEVPNLPWVVGHYSAKGIFVQLCALEGLFAADPMPSDELVQSFVRTLMAALEAKGIQLDERVPLMTLLVEKQPTLFVDEFWELLQDKSKTLRAIAVTGLRKVLGTDAADPAAELLGGRKIDTRLGAVALIAALGGPTAIALLAAALDTEEKDKVRAAIQEALDEAGALPATDADRTAPAVPLADLEATFAKQAKRLKLPKGNWLKLTDLPPLPTSSGEPLSELGLTFLIAKQAKHKTIEPAPDVMPLIAHFDRTATTGFALALFDQWLASAQVAADRWVLVLVGVLADTRAIPVLKAPLQSWADNSRHKLAEWSAQAIALIPGDEALTILDSLAIRYRSKYKNIGRACREALEAAAAARGVSLDDLADLIVPDFGFDAERQRTFTWDGGDLIAVMGPDFKFSWINPETGKETKAMPAAAPDEVKTEVKELNKLLRESIKGQTARLELCLVRQRRWTVARWQELFEVNPLLQSFASRLVWGVYDGEGVLQTTLRRYPNGLLADAAGELVELEGVEGFVGMVHPLELEDEALSAWREHLGRMKVKPPFPQLDRPVARLDPQHRNRKEISVANGVRLSFGTFRSRAEKRGWQRGSVVDAGGISSYCKLFPGAGVEVYLFTDDIYIGCDPMDSMSLGVACFAKAGSVEVGSYTYDEPAGGDDPRVLAFGAIPPVVYSETISDLEAIVEGQTS